MITCVFFSYLLRIQVSTEAERNLLIYMIVVQIIVSAFVVVFSMIFQKRKNKMLLDKIKQKQLFETEISQTRLEIKEQTLKDVGQELHDNIGQILAVANMNMEILSPKVDEEIKESFIETKEAIRYGLSELRALSKSLNSDIITRRGFQSSIQTEVDRLNKLKLISAELIVDGDSTLFKEGKHSVILFRIIQEFISNTVKHAEATSIKIKIDYTDEVLKIDLIDNGKGFDLNKIEKSCGLLNMEKRAELINANFSLVSAVNKGVFVKMDFPYSKIILT